MRARRQVDAETKWLMAREVPRLRRYAMALVGDPIAADDLVQDCLERAMRKRHLWRREGSMRGWLYTILYSVFLNQSTKRNRMRREAPLDAAPEPPSPAAGPETHMVCNDILRAMLRLPPDQRAAIALTALEGLGYDEAAKALDIPIGTLRSRIARGRGRLREIYQGSGAVVSLRQVN